MDSITVGWNKHLSVEVHYEANRQSFQQDSMEKLPNHGEEVRKKRVHFDCPTPITKPQVFEDTESNFSERRQRLSLEDQDYISLSRNIFRSQ